MADFNDIWTITDGHRYKNQVVLFVTQQTDFVQMAQELTTAGFTVTVADYYIWAKTSTVNYQIVKQQ